MRVGVVGGTGVAGSSVVRVLGEAGHDVVAIARATGVDVVTGRGLDAALDGVDTVVDVSSVLTTRTRPSVAFFTAGTTRLLAAERRAGVRHHVVLSIVGVDRIGTGYYAGKLVQEQLVLAGAVPATVLRTTQFHEFAGQMLDRLRTGPVTPVPTVRVQPVAVDEVAARLADLATGPALGRVRDLAGPETHDLATLVTQVARARRARTVVLHVPWPVRAGRLMASGALLPGADADIGRTTFGEWVAGPRAAAASGRRAGR